MEGRVTGGLVRLPRPSCRKAGPIQSLLHHASGSQQDGFSVDRTAIRDRPHPGARVCGEQRVIAPIFCADDQPGQDAVCHGFCRLREHDSTFLGVLAGAALECASTPPRQPGAPPRGPAQSGVVRNLGLHRLLTVDAGDFPWSSARNRAPERGPRPRRTGGRPAGAGGARGLWRPIHESGEVPDVLGSCETGSIRSSRWHRAAILKLDPAAACRRILVCSFSCSEHCSVRWPCSGSECRRAPGRTGLRRRSWSWPRKSTRGGFHASHGAALGEGLSREDLFQRIVHAAILCTGALSACIFEKRSDNKMQGVAVEGLFPPHRPLPPQARAAPHPRPFYRAGVESEVFDLSEGVVGQVARTGEGVLIADAPADPRIVKHDDPALVVQSVIAAPIRFQDRTIGVLAVTNPADGLPFTASDFSLVMSLAERPGWRCTISSPSISRLRRNSSILTWPWPAASSNAAADTTPQVAGLVSRRSMCRRRRSAGISTTFFCCRRRGSASRWRCVPASPASLLMAICRTNLQQIASRHDSPAWCWARSTAPWRGRSVAGCSLRSSMRWSTWRGTR